PDRLGQVVVRERRVEHRLVDDVRVHVGDAVRVEAGFGDLEGVPQDLRFRGLDRANAERERGEQRDALAEPARGSRHHCWRAATVAPVPVAFAVSMSTNFHALYVRIGWRRYPMSCGYHMSVRMRFELTRHGA